MWPFENCGGLLKGIHFVDVHKLCGGDGGGGGLGGGGQVFMLNA